MGSLPVPSSSFVRGGLIARTAAALAVALCAVSAARGEEDPALHIRRAGAEFAEIERSEVAKLSAELDGILGDAALMKLFQERDRAKLLAAAEPLFRKLKAQKGITHFYFLDPAPARTCLLRVHAPSQFGDVVQRTTLTKAINTGELSAGMELGKTAFALRVVKPAKVGGKLVGYVELGEEIDQFLSRMKQRTGHDYTIFVEKARISREDWQRVHPESHWDELPTFVLVDSTIWNSKAVDFGRSLGLIPNEGLVLKPWTDGGKQYMGAVFPIRDATGTVAGALFVRQLATGG
jgi:hypothetical protein